jgi:hypothetical protein
MKVYLTIPFEELEFAKKQGVKWDLDKKMWFIQDHPSMSQVYDDSDNHPFIVIFGKWFANKMKKTKRERPVRHKHIVVQPRTPRKKNKKSR